MSSFFGSLVSSALWCSAVYAAGLVGGVSAMRRRGARVVHTPSRAELWNPAASRWEDAGAVETVWGLYRLDDGRVAAEDVVPPGDDHAGPTGVAVWDRAARRWTHGAAVVPRAPRGPWPEALPAPPLDPAAGTWVTGPAGRAAAHTPDGAFARYDGAAWQQLPPPREPRSSAHLLLLDDGALLVAGGMLLTPREERGPNPVAVAIVAPLALAAAGVALAVHHRLHWSGVVVGSATTLAAWTAATVAVARALAWR